MSDNHFEKLFSVLERQTDTKLPPKTLLGYLGMINLMSIMSLVHSSEVPGEVTLSTGSSVDSSQSGEKSLKSALAGLMSAGNPNSGVPDLSGLLNMVGGNKKINPQMLLTLMNLLNTATPKQEIASDNRVKKEVKEEANSEIKPASSEKSEKKSKLF